MPDDAQWAQDRATIVRALGLINQAGEPTPRLKTIAELDFIRQTEADWQQERQAMIQVCSQCHSENFAQGELAKGDDMIRQADELMAEAIELVAHLYEEGLLDKPEGYQEAFPDLLAFHDAPSTIEQKLFRMFQEYRMRAFQGVFHANPDYALWYGWSTMKQTLTEMKDIQSGFKAASD